MGKKHVKNTKSNTRRINRQAKKVLQLITTSLVRDLI